ncbi:MAG TPA: hypothetical protein VGO61_09215 [Steroidobacteraceae bacterium]|nr:hypothetical protein [Steroidobacteraceae bacterium]
MPVSPKVDAPRLQLARETQPVSVGGRCVTVGPFATNELAARARQTLNDSGYTSMPREVAVRSFDGYWVYLESPPTESGERRLLDRLHKGGIADAQGMGELGSARRISLGIFSDEARAAAQSEKVAKLGLLPQIEAREKGGTAIWLDLTLKSDSPPLEGSKFPAGDAELEFRPCPAPEAPAP